MLLPACELASADKPSMAEQLVAFAERAQGRPHTRAWLEDPVDDLKVYVRARPRDLGRPLAILFGYGEEDVIREDIDCLDIANLERRTSLEPVSWDAFFSFIRTVGQLGIWKAVCLENLGDKELTDWAKSHGWTDLQRGTPDFCYIHLPDVDPIDPYGDNTAAVGQLPLDRPTQPAGD